MNDPLDARLRRAFRQADRFAVDAPSAAVLLDRRRRRRTRRAAAASAVLVLATVVALAVVSPGGEPAETVAAGAGTGPDDETETEAVGTTSTVATPPLSPLPTLTPPRPVGGPAGSVVPPTTVGGGAVTTSVPAPPTSAAPPITVVSPPTVGPPPPTTAPAAPPVVPPPAMVTSADAGRTYRLTPGQQLQVELTGNGQGSWSGLSSSDAAVLAPTDVARRGDGSAGGTFTAAAPGQATVTAVQSPACGQATPPCLAPARLFEVTVLVG